MIQLEAPSWRSSPCSGAARSVIGIHFGQKPPKGQASPVAVHIIPGMLPAVVVIGLVIHSWIRPHLFGPQTVTLYALVAGGIPLIIAEICPA